MGVAPYVDKTAPYVTATYLYYRVRYKDRIIQCLTEDMCNYHTERAIEETQRDIWICWVIAETHPLQDSDKSQWLFHWSQIQTKPRHNFL